MIFCALCNTKHRANSPHKTQSIKDILTSNFEKQIALLNLNDEIFSENEMR